MSEQNNQATAHEVLSTVGYPGFVRALYNRSGDISKDFTHAVLGCITEIHEYIQAPDHVNAVEEAGDLLFYLEALKQVLNDHSPLDNAAYPGFEQAAMEQFLKMEISLESVKTEWLDLAKRWVGYGKAPTMSTTQLLAEMNVLVISLIQIGGAKGVSPYDVELANVRKLLTRYNGMAFSAERAVNRDLAAERKVLEDAGSN